MIKKELLNKNVEKVFSRIVIRLFLLLIIVSISIIILPDMCNAQIYSSDLPENLSENSYESSSENVLNNVLENSDLEYSGIQSNIIKDYSIYTDKPFYIVSDIVNILVLSYDSEGNQLNDDIIDGVDLFIESKNNNLNGVDSMSYKYLGVIDSRLAFSPDYPGEYYVRIFSEGMMVDEKSFLVYDESYLGCEDIFVNETFYIELNNYESLKDNSGNIVLPEKLDLLFDDSYGMKKFVYSPIFQNPVSWNPSQIGRYSLYADGFYLDCFKVSSRVEGPISHLMNLSNNDLVGNILGNNAGFGLGSDNLSVSNNFAGAFEYSKNNSKIKILDSKGGPRSVNVKFFVSELSVGVSVSSVGVSVSSNTGDISNDTINVSDYVNVNVSGDVNFSDVVGNINVSENNISGDVNFSDVVGDINVSENLSRNISENNPIDGFVSQNAVVGQQLPLSEISENNLYDVEILFEDSSVNSIKLNGLKYTDNSEIGVDELDKTNNYILGRTAQKAYAINLYDLEFNSSSFTAVASATELWKCKDWNFTMQECFGTWELYMNLTPGEEYTVALYPGDPGFVEAFDSNLSVDVDLASLDNNTVVLAWVSASTGFPLKFKILDTNGSILVNDTTLDATGDATSRVSIAKIDSVRFVIGSFDGPAQAQYFYIYDRSGNALQGQTLVDPTVGTQSDVDVCELGDRFVFIYANDDAADQDADFQIFNNSGVQIVAENNVDGSMAPELSNQNLISCAAINTTHWAYSWYDAGTADDISISARTGTGTAVVTADLDTSVGNTPQVANTGLRNRRVAVAFYDSADDDITITVRQLNGATLATTLAATDIDTNAGTESRVAIEEIDMVSQSYFVVAWYDALDTTIKAGIYNETGAQITAPFNVTQTPSTTNRILDLAGYSSVTNIGLCNGTWAIAYSNASGMTVWETYYYTGERWNGVCPDVTPPIVTLTSPENDSIIELSSYTINYTVTDNRDIILRNCSLYANFSEAFSLNRTSYNVSVGENHFNISSIPDRQYIWNVRCFDNSSNNAFAQTNYTYKQNYYLPNISGIGINRTVINQSRTVRFNATIVDSWGINYSYIQIYYPNGSDMNISLDRIGSLHYKDFNDTIQVGQYNITLVWANDSLGQSNNTPLSLSFNVTSSDPANFNLIAPLNSTVSSILVPNMTWQQTIDDDFSNYTLIIDTDPDFATPDFIYYIYSMANSYYVLDFSLDANTQYYWMVTAYDIFGNYRNSTDKFKYVTDTLAASVSLNSPQNNTYVSGNAVFDYTPTDINGIDRCVLYGNWSGSFIQNETNNSILSSQSNYFNLNLLDGIYLWNIRCFDVANNSGFAAANNTFIVDNTGPIVSLAWPQNNTLENSTNNVVFYGNATDTLSDVANCSLILDGSTVRFKSPIIEEEIFNMTYFVENGQHNWSMFCIDSNGNFGYSQIYNLTVNVIDNDPPFIVRNYPSDNLHIPGNSLVFNFTVDDSTGIENCSIYINSNINSTNYSIINHENNYFSVSNLGEGSYGWDIECYDNTTQKNRAITTTRTLNVDLTSPTVTLINPQYETYINYSDVIFEYVPFDNHLLSCSLYANFFGTFEYHQINTTPDSGVSNYFSQNIADGVYVWNVLCVDESSRSAFASQNYTFVIDTTPPYYYNISVSPESPAIFSNQKYFFNITLGDNINLSVVMLENNFSGTMENYTIVDYVAAGEDRKYYYVIENLSAGTYYYKWYANDSTGNLNSTMALEYNIDKSNSTIYAILDGVNSNKSVNENNYVNLSLQLSIPGAGYVELLLDGTIINNGNYETGELYNYTYFDIPGFYNLTAVYYSTNNYSSSSDSIFLTVNDTTDPNIVLLSPGNNSPVSAGDINLQYVVNDDSSIINCSLYINGSLISNSSTVLTNVTQGFTVPLGVGNYTWYVDCYDDFNNYNSSLTRSFSAFNVSIVLVGVSSDNSIYQSGENVQIDINTTGFFGDSLNANFTADIILGNTTVPWWNNSFMYRKAILLNNTYNTTLFRSIEVNLTGFNGSISNCTHLRIINFDGTNSLEMPYEVLSGDNNDSCNIWFVANVPALSTSSATSSQYYVYFNATANPYSGIVELYGTKIQRGTIAGTAVSLTANIESANRSKSFVLFTVNAGSSAPTIIQFTPTMSIDTQIGFDRYGSGTSSNISWQLIESSDMTVQRGSNTLVAAQASVNFTISPVNINNSFILVDGRVNTATAGNNIQGFFTGRFINNTFISLERATTGTVATASYQVVEWNKTRVQSGNVTFTTLSSVRTIDPVNVSRSFIIISRRESGDTGPDASLIYANFINSTAINLSRATAVGTASVQWFVVELPESYSVQNGQTSVSATDVNQPINPVLMRKSFHVEKWSNTNGGTTYSNALMTSRLTNISNILFDKQTATNVNAISWFMIEEKQPDFSIGSREIFIDSMINDTAPLGVYSWLFSTLNKSLSTYSVVVFAEKNGYQSGYNYNNFDIGPDETLPTVQLLNPEDLHISGQGYFNFSYIPYDLNLNNCTLYYGLGQLVPNATNSSPMNNATNFFNNIYVGIGLYSWNVLCYDTFGNSAFAQYNYTLNITGPDLYLDTYRIVFSEGPRVEGTNITIFANVSNEGLSPVSQSFTVRFFRNDPSLGGVQINGDKIINSLDPLESMLLNVTYELDLGINNIFVTVDSTDIINESLENNNKANRSLSVELYQYYYGNIEADLLLASGINSSIKAFRNTSISQGAIFVSDYDSSFSFANLQALGRNKVGDLTNNDFSDLDTSLGTTGFIDSINIVWADDINIPVQTGNISFSSMIINNVPLAQSTNNTNFYTGILWDTADDSSNNFQYDSTDKEDVVFVTSVEYPKEGAYGLYTYETRIPAPLREYDGGSDAVAFYFELT
ncbi:MAG: hypothetical protein ACP5NV_03720 [Candidatus Woesearchaeota archaeon]